MALLATTGQQNRSKNTSCSLSNKLLKFWDIAYDSVKDGNGKEIFWDDN